MGSSPSPRTIYRKENGPSLRGGAVSYERNTRFGPSIPNIARILVTPFFLLTGGDHWETARESLE